MLNNPIKYTYCSFFSFNPILNLVHLKNDFAIFLIIYISSKLVLAIELRNVLSLSIKEKTKFVFASFSFSYNKSAK